MFEEPEESADERAFNPAVRAREKSDEFRMHAELASVFEACRKFEAQIHPSLDPDLARDIQKRIAQMEKAKLPETPILKPEVMESAAEVLNLPRTCDVATNDYHIYRRPGEVMIVRWLAGEQVETFYQRLQAHFDAAMEHFRAEERSAHEWRQDPQTLAYLDAMDKVEVKMAERYLRDVIRKHRVMALSTQTVDEMDILHLCDYVMGAEPAEIVGAASARPEQPTERDRAWFFKLFSLRGIVQEIEKMCFFTFMQKAEDTFDTAW